MPLGHPIGIGHREPTSDTPRYPSLALFATRAATRRGFRSGTPKGFTIHPGSYDCPPQEIETGPDVGLGDTLHSTQEVSLR